MADRPTPFHSRPPALRIVLIAALFGAAFGLLEVGERRATPPFPVDLLTVTDEVMAADLHYRYALFACDLAARSGAPGVSSPSAWEEQAVATYERLALRESPDPAACHRLGLIYARRGYLRQAREMLARALAHDDSGGTVYWALILVYSEQPIKAKDVLRVREGLLSQPRWLAAWSLADLARRVNLAPLAAHYEARAMREIRLFGWLVTLFAATGLAIVALALLASIIAVTRWLLLVADRPRIWLPALPPLQWVQVVDVAALAAFGNALGQVCRDYLAASVPSGSETDLALRVAHTILATVPPVGLVIARVRRKPDRWWQSLGLVSTHVPSHLFQGIVGLGLTLAGSLVARELLSSLIQSLLPAALSAQVNQTYGAHTLAINVVLIVGVAPLVEELIFRGFIFRALLDQVRPFGAAVASAALFSISHTPGDPRSIVSVFVLGLVSAYLYLRSRSLIPSLVLHAGYNATILIAAAILRA